MSDFGQCPCGMAGPWHDQPWTGSSRRRAATITNKSQPITQWATWTWDDGMVGTCHGDSMDGTNMVMHRSANQDAHITAHQPGTPWADDVTLCGVDHSEMRKQTSFFVRWFDTICPTCSAAVDFFS